MPPRQHPFDLAIGLCLFALTIVQSWIEVFELLPEYLYEYIQERREAPRLRQALQLAEENNTRALAWERSYHLASDQRQETWEENQRLEEEIIELEVKVEDLQKALTEEREWKEEIQAEDR